MNGKNATGFIGLTHLGIVSSICWASKFPNIIGFDHDIELTKKLSSGKTPLEEPQLQNLLDKNLKFLTFTTNFKLLSKCSNVYISLDTKTDEENQSEYEPLYNLIDKSIPYLPQGVTIILMSQVPVGFCRELKEYIKKKRPELDFKLIYMVETLIIGDAVNRCLHPERIVIGTETGKNNSLDKNKILKNQLSKLDAPLIFMRYESAELTKLAINFYLFISVTYANLLSDICEAYSADMNEIIPALRLDKRIGPHAYIQPSLGVTGGHLERDMMTLKELEKKMGTKLNLTEILINLNKDRYKWLEKKIEVYLLSNIKKPRICIWGLSYKRDTDSVKGSFALKIINKFADLAKFSAYDPLVQSVKNSYKVEICRDRYDAVQGAHCLIIFTNPDEFRILDFKRLKKLMNYPLIIDCANLYSNYEDQLREFKYINIGKAILNKEENKP